MKITIHKGQTPTASQLEEVRRAASRPIIPDEDAPMLTEEQYAQMEAMAKEKRKKNGKSVISPETL